MKIDEDIHSSYFYCNILLSILLSLTLERCECEGHWHSVSHLSPKNSKQDMWHVTALLAVRRHAIQKRLQYHSHLSAESLHAWTNRILHLGSCFTVHQFVFREGSKASHLQLFIQPMKYLWRKLFLFDRPHQSSSKSTSSCDGIMAELKKWKTK